MVAPLFHVMFGAPADNCRLLFAASIAITILQWIFAGGKATLSARKLNWQYLYISYSNNSTIHKTKQHLQQQLRCCNVFLRNLRPPFRIIIIISIFSFFWTHNNHQLPASPRSSRLSEWFSCNFAKITLKFSVITVTMASIIAKLSAIMVFRRRRKNERNKTINKKLCELCATCSNVSASTLTQKTTAI